MHPLIPDGKLMKTDSQIKKLIMRKKWILIKIFANF